MLSYQASRLSEILMLKAFEAACVIQPITYGYRLFCSPNLHSISDFIVVMTDGHITSVAGPDMNIHLAEAAAVDCFDCGQLANVRI